MAVGNSANSISSMNSTCQLASWMSKDHRSHHPLLCFFLFVWFMLVIFFSVLILKRDASVVVIAQRGFNPPAACDEYSAADTHSPRLSLLLHANVASRSFPQHDTSMVFFFCYKGGSRDESPPTQPPTPVLLPAGVKRQGGRGNDSLPGLR